MSEDVTVLLFSTRPTYVLDIKRLPPLDPNLPEGVPDLLLFIYFGPAFCLSMKTDLGCLVSG